MGGVALFSAMPHLGSPPSLLLPSSFPHSTLVRGVGFQYIIGYILASAGIYGVFFLDVGKAFRSKLK